MQQSNVSKIALHNILEAGNIVHWQVIENNDINGPVYPLQKVFIGAQKRSIIDLTQMNIPNGTKVGFIVFDDVKQNTATSEDQTIIYHENGNTAFYRCFSEILDSETYIEGPNNKYS